MEVELLVPLEAGVQGRAPVRGRLVPAQGSRQGQGNLHSPGVGNRLLLVALGSLVGRLESGRQTLGR